MPLLWNTITRLRLLCGVDIWLILRSLCFWRVILYSAATAWLIKTLYHNVSEYLFREAITFLFKDNIPAWLNSVLSCTLIWVSFSGWLSRLSWIVYKMKIIHVKQRILLNSLYLINSGICSLYIRKIYVFVRKYTFALCWIYLQVRLRK